MAFSHTGLADFELELPPSRKSSSASETDSDEFFDAEDLTPKSRCALYHSFQLNIMVNALNCLGGLALVVNLVVGVFGSHLNH